MQHLGQPLVIGCCQMCTDTNQSYQFQNSESAISQERVELRSLFLVCRWIFVEVTNWLQNFMGSRACQGIFREVANMRNVWNRIILWHELCFRAAASSKVQKFKIRSKSMKLGQVYWPLFDHCHFTFLFNYFLASNIKPKGGPCSYDLFFQVWQICLQN